MSALLNSYLVDPVIRQARRFSSAPLGSNDGSTPSSLAPTTNAPTESSSYSIFDPGPNPEPDLLANIFDPSRIAATLRNHTYWRDQSSFTQPDTAVNPTSSPSSPQVSDVPQAHPQLHSCRQDISDAEGAILSFPKTNNDEDEGTPSFKQPNGDRASLENQSTSLLYSNPTRSSNPFLNVLGQDVTPERMLLSSSRTTDPEGSGDIQFSIETSSRQHNEGESPMSTSLPEDDGMQDLRNKMHQIHAIAVSNEDRAKRMHTLMMADYEKFKALRRPATRRSSPASSFKNYSNLSKNPYGSSDRPQSPDSASSTDESDLLSNVKPSDLEPTYHHLSSSSEHDDAPGDESSDVVDSEQDLALGCKHYMRNVKVRCVDCLQWYTCRHCHDEAEGHELEQKNVKSMLCMLCGFPQKVGDYCRQCGEQAAVYYCGICKLWDNDPTKSIYHCDGCGICRRGEGLGKDFVHCNRCNVCVSSNHAASHICVERATECDCPICGDYMFTSAATVVAMKCGHYMHRACYNDYMQTSYRCPICNHSAVNMELQWRKLDHCILTQPMPESYQGTKAWIFCNDCSARTCTTFHWLGNKCVRCDSYNTNEIRLLNEPPASSPDHQSFTSPASHRSQISATLPNQGHTMQSSEMTRESRIVRDHGVNDSMSDGMPIPEGRRNIIFSEPLPRCTDTLGDEESAFQRTQRSAEDVIVQHPQPVGPGESLSYQAPHQNVLESRESSDRSSDAMTEDDLNDETSFWGESISPSSFVPTGWTSPRLFASSPTSQDDDKAEGSDTPGGGSVWPPFPVSPSQWRLGSPRLFSLNEESGEADIARNQNSSWPINPSQWRLGSPGLFNFGAESRDNDDDDHNNGDSRLIHEETTTSSRWLPNVTPGFLTRTLSDWTEEDAVVSEPTDDDDDDDDDSEDGTNEGSDSEDRREAGLKGFETEEEEEQDEMEFFGHR